MRSTAFATIKPLIDNEYEEACYELAYDMLPVAKCIAALFGIKTETDMVKIFLKFRGVYDACKAINDEEVSRVNRYNAYMHEYTQNMEIYYTKMTEYMNYEARLNTLRSKYNLSI